MLGWGCMQVIGLILCLVIIPYCTGLLFYNKRDGIFMPWVYGIVTDWAAFQIPTVFFIHAGKSLHTLVPVYFMVTIVPAIAGLALLVSKIVRSRQMDKKPEVKPSFEKFTLSEFACLAIFVLVVAFQLYKTIFYAFSDGDDAYYVAVSQHAFANGAMYLNNPYTGIATGINYRYALAPFPMWIAYLARISNINVATVAHVVCAPTLILMSYVIYNSLAKSLFKENREKRYMFLTLYAVFATFSNVSQSTAESFLLTRSRQGKAALAGIVIPLLVYVMLRSLDDECRLCINAEVVPLLVVITLGGALTTMFSNVLLSFVFVFMAIWTLARKGNIKNLIGIVIAEIPCLTTVALYFLWR